MEKCKVFISYKYHDENGSVTPDFYIGKSVYDKLSGMGIPTFYSDESIINYAQSDYKRIIDEKLDEAEFMIVISSSPDYCNSKWVRYEWDGFYNDILSERKNGCLISLLDTKNISSFPRSIRNNQVFLIDENGIENLVDFVCSYFKITIKDKTNAQNSDEHYKCLGYKEIAKLNMNFERIKEDIINLTNDAATEQNPGLEVNINMLKRLPENWRVILDCGGQIVAYWLFVALEEETYCMMKDCEICENDIDMSKINFIDFPGDYKGYILQSGIKADMRTIELVRFLFESLVKHIEYLSSLGIFFSEICGLAISPQAESALKKIGMKKYKEHKIGGKIYWCDMKKVSSNSYLSSFEKLNCLYSSHYGES